MDSDRAPLIRQAVRLAHREHGWTIFIAYGDPEAGEIGTIYQALGWRYIGVGRNGRAREEYRKPGGTVWHSERILGHSGLKKAEALALGWHHRRRAAKHRYVWFEDSTLASCCRYESLPYPKRRRLPRADARAQARSGRTCLVCAKPLTALRSTRTTCSARCRIKLLRDRRRKGPRRRYLRPPKTVTVTPVALKVSSRTARKARLEAERAERSQKIEAYRQRMRPRPSA